jgi:hypothetical protein
MQRIFLALLLVACSDTRRGGGTLDFAAPPGSDLAQPGCEGQNNCYTVYAHADHVLYSIDLMAKTLVTVGPFRAPMVNGSEDVITDLAVAPDGTIYVVSERSIYTADPSDGHVTLLGPLTACGQACVALSFTADNKLYTADFKGAFCNIDISMSPPKVTSLGSIGRNLAVSGDLVAVADGTMFATVYDLSTSSTQNNNMLATIDPSSGAVSAPIGATGSPKLFGAAYALGKVFGFTHDGSGDVVTINPTTGVGTAFNTFNDPSTGKGISFAGAGVNALVPLNPIM